MIVGVDVSSYRIDLAYLDTEGRPQRWHQQLDKRAHLIDRLREIRVQWPGSNDINEYRMPEDVTDIAIEYPWARGNGVPALWATVGVITRQAPPWARVAWPEPRDLRAAIGAKNTKADAHAKIRFLMDWVVDGKPLPAYHDLSDWDEHELDALVACVGWTKILERQA